MKGLILICGVGLVLGGCSKEAGHDEHGGTGHHEHEDEHGHDHGEEAGAEFVEGKGLRLGEEAGELIGLERVKARKELLPLDYTGRARVFHAAHQHTVDFPGQKEGHAYANMMVPITEARMFEKGQRVEVSGSGREGTVEGRLASLDFETARAVGQGEAVVEVPDAKEQFEFGSVLQVRITGVEREALVVPRRAVVDAATGTFVYRVQDGLYERMPVKTGGGNEEFVEVTEGLQAGEEVVARGAKDLWLIELRLTKGGGHTH